MGEKLAALAAGSKCNHILRATLFTLGINFLPQQSVSPILQLELKVLCGYQGEGPERARISEKRKHKLSFSARQIRLCNARPSLFSDIQLTLVNFIKLFA